MQAISLFSERFLNREDVWCYQWESGKGYTSVRPGNGKTHPRTGQYQRVDAELIAEHLQGGITLSVPALDEVFCSRWCCWDADDDSGELLRVRDLLIGMGLHPMREAARPGRDGHLWLFFDQPVSAVDLIRFDRTTRKALGIDTGALEFFPKTDKGWSQVRLPLGVNRKPEAAGALGWFESAAQTIPDQLDWINQQPLDSPLSLLRVSVYARYCEEHERATKPDNRHFDSLSEHQKRDLLDDQSRLVNLRKANPGNLKCQCPSCAVAGRDQHGRDNLHILESDGTVFKCWAGCSTKDILAVM